MKLPITFNREHDLLALKWLVKATLVYVLFSQFLWQLGAETEIGEPLTRVLAWELKELLNLLGYEVARNQSTLSVEGLPFQIKIIPRCLGFLVGGGGTIFLTFVLTLPASSLRARVFWIVVGALVIDVTNLLRLVLVIVLSLVEPLSFEPIHKLSMDINTVVGGILAFLTVQSLSLKPRGIRVFRRSRPNDAAS